MRANLIHCLSPVVVMVMLFLAYDLDAGFAHLHLGIQLSLVGLFLLLKPGLGKLALLVHVTLMLLAVPLAVLHADNYHSYGPLLRETLDALFQTSNSEAISYVQTFSSPRFVPLALISLVLVFSSLWPVCQTGGGPGWQAGIVLFIGGVLLFAGRDLPLQIYAMGKDYSGNLKAFGQSRAEVLKQLGPVTTEFKGTVVLLLGESLSRQHLGVYGYPRPTTPSLSARKEALTIYRDVISSFSHTNESLSRALTLNYRAFDEQDQIRPISAVPDLLNVARASGIQTWWLSNQNAIGLWDNAVAVLAAEADVTRYHDPGGGFQLGREVFDEALVQSLKEALNAKTPAAKLIVLNLMAAHSPYCDMVPPNFEVRGFEFSDPVMDQRFFGDFFNQLTTQLDEAGFVRYLGQFNCYDRAVNYVDNVAGQVMDILETAPGEVVMLMTADHGEAPILATGHDSRRHSHWHVEVPFLLWQNEAYRSGSFLTLNPDRRGTLADLSYSVLSLLRVDGPGLAKDRSLFAEEYDLPARMTMDERVGYEVYDAAADHVERTRANLFALAPEDRRRVWVHRVNAGAAMLEARDVFAGVEMDVVFDGEAHKIFHPPAPDVGLTLDFQLRMDRPGLGYWLDWKNADPAGLRAALTAFQALDDLHGIKHRTLVESSLVSPELKRFSQGGWHTSYYLPTASVLACMSQCDEVAQATLAAELWQQVESSGYQAVSFDAKLVTFVEQHLLQHLKRSEMPAYTWAIDIDMSSPDANARLAPLLARDWLKVVLVTMPSHFAL